MHARRPDSFRRPARGRRLPQAEASSVAVPASATPLVAEAGSAAFSAPALSGRKVERLAALRLGPTATRAPDSRSHAKKLF